MDKLFSESWDVLIAEDVHIFELCPKDWLKLAKFAGWRPIFTKYYFQYPKMSPLRLSSFLWKRIDFEGFVAFMLKVDLSVANRYRDW